MKINIVENKYIDNTKAYLVSPMKVEDYKRGVIVHKIVKIEGLSKPTPTQPTERGEGE